MRKRTLVFEVSSRELRNKFSTISQRLFGAYGWSINENTTGYKFEFDLKFDEIEQEIMDSLLLKWNITPEALA